MAGFKAAAAQMRSGTSVKANLDEAERLIREAAAQGADYVLTPEMTNILCKDRAHLLASTQPEEGNPALARFTGLAREIGIHVHIGSMAVRLGPDSVANRSYLIGPDGGVIARYDKIHMFDVTLPGGESYQESALYRPGDTAVVADLPFARLGLTICYDVRFPDLYHALAVAAANVMAVPAAFTRTTGEAHWHVLLRARAIETGAFVIAAAQGGHHEDGRDTYCHSMIVDPWGHIVAEGGTEPGVVIATIDPGKSADARRRIPALANTRPFAAPAVPAAARAVA
jgi:deaminated glutathione amidase